MSAPSPAASSVADEYIADVQAMTMNSTLGIVVAALLLYDILLTSGQEYLYIWQSSKTWTSRVVYLWNRYMYSVYYILSLGAIQSISDTSCSSLVWISNVVGILSLIGPAMFTTLRIYALSRKSKILGGLALVLGMAPFVVNAISAYQRPPINLPAPLNCTEDNTASTSVNIGLTIASRSALILVDSLAVVVTWWQTRAAVQLRAGTMKQPSLERVMWENGTIYFCTLVSINIVDMVLDILSITVTPGAASSYVVAFVDPISSALNSRFLLALHETNARMSGTDASMVSSLNFNAVSGGDLRASSRELPGSLGVLGGPIHSFNNDDSDEDLGSLQLASWSQEEHKGEQVLGEIVESGGDGEDIA